MIVPQTFSFRAYWRHLWDYLRRGFKLSLLLMVTGSFLISCTGLNLGGSSSSPSPTATASHLPLAKLHWCGKPVIIFRDEGTMPTPTPTAGGTPSATATATAGGTPTGTATPTVTASPTATGVPATVTPTTLTDWAKVKPNLGFTVFLPPTLPRNSCLVSAAGTLHDPIFGGSFTIGYLLPNHSPLSLAEAPLRSQNPEFQCSPSTSATPRATPTTQGGTPAATLTVSPTQAPTQLCSGARDTTNIVFSAQGSSGNLKQFFDTLKPDIDWVPAS